MKNWLVRAREASGLSQEMCACALRCSLAVYADREAHPGTLSINEIRALRTVYCDESRRILWESLREFEAR